MSCNKFVTSTLVALLLGTSSVSYIAHAQEPELYFYPKSKWVVERINSKQEPNGICSISNKLNNGYMLELSGSKQGISNINIDFRQNVFQKNFKYEIQYIIPGISRAIIPSRATRENLIASDLSEKRDFAKNLASAGVLDVQIRDNSFRIYLTGLKASMSQFDDCVSPIKLLANKDKKSPPASGNALMEDIMETAPELETETEPKLTKIKEDLAPPPPIPVEVVTADPVISEDSVAEEGVATDPRKLRPKPSNRPRYTEMIAEKLKQESEQYKPTKSLDPIVKPEDNIHEKVDRIDETRAVPALLDKPVKTSAIIEAPNETTINNVRSPKAVYHITKNKEPIVVDLTKDAVNVADIEPAAGQIQSSIINDDFIAMRNKISEMEKELISVREKNKILDEELKIALQDSEKERISVSSDNWNLERATMKFNEAERQIMRLGRQLQTQRAVCEQEKANLENMLFDPKLTDQNQLAKLALLEKELDDTKSELYRQKRQYEERIRLLEQQLESP